MLSAQVGLPGLEDILTSAAGEPTGARVCRRGEKSLDASLHPGVRPNAPGSCRFQRAIFFPRALEVATQDVVLARLELEA
jgi:hypothetical protein